MISPTPFARHLAGYPPALVAQVERLARDGRLGPLLRDRYPQLHDVKSDRALAGYAAAIREEFLRKAERLDKVLYDSRLHPIANALGTHTTAVRVQGAKLKAKRELRVATLFRELPEAFLRMIVVHELAHLKEREHDRAFYQLCRHMEPDYHQLEFDLRVYLAHRAAGGAEPWAAEAAER